MFLQFAIEIKNKEQIHKFSESSKSRMQRFEEPHAVRETQFDHPWFRSTAKSAAFWDKNFWI